MIIGSINQQQPKNKYKTKQKQNRQTPHRDQNGDSDDEDRCRHPRILPSEVISTRRGTELQQLLLRPTKTKQSLCTVHVNSTTKCTATAPLCACVMINHFNIKIVGLTPNIDTHTHVNGEQTML